MKVGTDGIMLGAWARVGEAQRILDIGTGTGLLALMAAQRNPKAEIVGIEIDPQTALQAQENVAKSPWKDRIQISTQDIRSFEPSSTFEAILCNPPYFTSGILPTDPQRKQARHSDDLSYEELLLFAARHLSPKGSLSLILPYENEAMLLQLAQENGLFSHRLLHVRTRSHKPIRRSLIELRPTQTKSIIEELNIHTDTSNTYSEAYQALTGTFYLP